MTKQEIITWLGEEIAAHEDLQSRAISPNEDLNRFTQNLKTTLVFVKGCPWIQEPEIEASE